MRDWYLTRAALTVALLIVLTTHAITRIFALNFSTAGPNLTALLSLTLLTGGGVTILLQTYSRRRDRVLVGGAAAGTVTSLVSPPLVSLVGATIALWALTALTVVDTAQIRDQIGVAVGIGLLLTALVRAVTGTTAPHATALGLSILGVMTGTLVFVSVWLRHHGEFNPETDVRHVAPLATVVLCAAAWLGAPVASARWAGLSYQLTLASSIIGFLAGLVVVTRGVADSPRQIALAAGALVVGLGGILVGGPLAAAGVTLASAALPVLGAVSGVAQTTPFRAGLATVCAQGGCLFVLFGFVFAVNATFVPGGTLLRGTAPAFAVSLAGIVGLTALAVATLPTESEDTPGDDRVTHSSLDGTTRRGTLTGAGLGLVAPLAAIIRDPQPTADTPAILRVATYNIHRYLDANGAYSLESVATLLASHNLGIVGLQETIGTRLTTGHTHGVRWLADRCGYHYALAPATSAIGYGVALLSAWPIRDAETVSLPQGNGAPRVALRAVVAHPDGDLPVVVAHLATDGPIRTRQALRVRALVSGSDQAVVLGDFNATPAEKPIKRMTDTFCDAWATAGTGSGATFDAATPSRRIDYVFTRGLRVQAAAVFGTSDDSDHRGVYATIEQPRS